MPIEFDHLPTATGWYWVTWLPGDVSEPVHVIVNDPPDDTVLWMHDEDAPHERITLEECRASGTTWFDYPVKNLRG